MNQTRPLVKVAAMFLLLGACSADSASSGASTSEPVDVESTVSVTETSSEASPSTEATTDTSTDTSLDSDTTAAEDEGSEGGSEVPDANDDLPDMTTATFSEPTTVDNQWFPRTPGTQFIFEGTTVEEGEDIPHRVVFTVTDLTKVIEGIPTVVMWDQDFSDGELVEAELAFFAQDDDGNVWHLGEYPEEYEEGELIDAPSWIAGLDGALAGISMKADPQAGTPSYAQGWGPEVEWTDRGQVDAVGQDACVEAGCFDNVLVIAEWALEEREDGVQLKFYAPNVGNIQVGWRGDDANQEDLELIEVVMLDDAELLEARERALELEASAYETSPDMYGLTEPLVAPEG